MPAISFAQPDITLHLDDDGVIREAAVSDALMGETVASLVGLPWPETVCGGAQGIERMLEDARQSGVSAFRQVMQRFPSGRELPIEYTTLRAPGGRSGLLALGRNLQVVAELQSRLVAAQQASEREYWKLRDVETRYRLLFDSSNEAVLMVGGGDLRIVEANPAARRSLGLAPGAQFPGEVPPREREAFLAMLEAVRERGRAPGIVLHIGAAMAPWAVRASLVPTEPGRRFLLHVATAGTGPTQSAAERLPIDEMLERLPDGFVVVGADGMVLRANRAFLDLIQASSLDGVRGERLQRWVSRPGADAAVLLQRVALRQTVRRFQTSVSGENGAETPVEVTAAATPDDPPRFCVLVLRDMSRGPPHDQDPPLEAMMQACLEQIGHTPLLSMVRSTTDAVEWRLIQEALRRVRGNRTAAAELLGLSRQSLHAKLNRHASRSQSGHGRSQAGE